MCVVSSLGDHYGQNGWPQPATWPSPYNGPTREQFEEFLELLRAAKKIDAITGQPDCETEVKMKGLKKFLTLDQIDEVRKVLGI